MESLAESGRVSGRAPRSALLTVPEVSEHLKISEARVRELGRLGLLPIVRLGRQVRIDPERLDAWIAEGGQALPGGWRREAE